jgi:transposase
MSAPKDKPKPLLTPLEELVAIVEQARTVPISTEQYTTLMGAIHAIVWLKEQWISTKVSVKRLLRIIFGPTESTRNVLREATAQGEDKQPAGADKTDPNNSGPAPPQKKRVKGHGHHKAADYPGATLVPVPHNPALNLHEHGPCPDPDCGGKLYAMEPSVQMRFHAAALIRALMYQCQRLRCGLCLTVHTAPLPPEAGDQKYDPSVAVAVGMTRYGAGMPGYRLANLQESFGIPLAPSTQWDLVEDAADAYLPVVQEIHRLAGNGTKVHNDDTTAKVLLLTQPEREEALGKEAAKKRTGTFTSGVYSVDAEGHMIADYFTGPKHAGENLTAVLQHRSPDLPPPIHMCDALDVNIPKALETILCRCMSHSRRKFVEIVERFPDEVRVVLLVLREIYMTDALAREQNLTDEQRLQLHRRLSRPLMIQLALWMRWLLAAHMVEPNSGLGQAIGYMRKNWFELTRFYRTPGAPLDNNVVERMLKMVVLHRKNSLFFRTLNGARVADTFMTLIKTATLNGVSAFHYLLTLLLHRGELAKDPGRWMPWRYRQTLEALAGARGPDPPA